MISSVESKTTISTKHNKIKPKSTFFCHNDTILVGPQYVALNPVCHTSPPKCHSVSTRNVTLKFGFFINMSQIMGEKKLVFLEKGCESLIEWLKVSDGVIVRDRVSESVFVSERRNVCVCVCVSFCLWVSLCICLSVSLCLIIYVTDKK